MLWYNIIKNYYNLGLYTPEQVQVFVTAKWITAEQATEITSKEDVK